MITWAAEIPLSMWQYHTLTDFDFILAQDVLENEEYRQRYSSSIRFKILDNGFHELGYPLGVAELNEAAKAVHPNLVIAPDKLSDPAFTLESFKELQSTLQHGRVAAVLVGDDPSTHLNLWDAYMSRGAAAICLPYRVNRMEWFKRILDYRTMIPPIHLLGAKDSTDLLFFKTLMGKNYFRISIDTAKPLKWGLSGKYMHEQEWRHTPQNKARFTLDTPPATASQESIINWNCAYFRKHL